MANIEERKTRDGKTMYRVKVRLKGFPTQTATFHRRTDAKKWVQTTEAAMREGRHFKIAEAKKHTLADMIDRYLQDVLPRKSRSCQRNQGAHLRWWRKQIGKTLLADVTPVLIAEYRAGWLTKQFYRNQQVEARSELRSIGVFAHCPVFMIGWFLNLKSLKGGTPWRTHLTFMIRCLASWATIQSG